MAASVLVDAGFVVALLSNRDNHHGWAVAQARQFAPPWTTCEAALSEAFHLVGAAGASTLGACFAGVPCSLRSNWQSTLSPC